MCDQPHGLDAECVARFLDTIEVADLDTWLGVERVAPAIALRTAIDGRRRWAQGHQANPRHRDQSLWIIRHHRRLVEVLVDEEGGLARIDDEVAAIREQGLVDKVDQLADMDLDHPLLERLRERLGVRPPPQRDPTHPSLDHLLRQGLDAGLPALKLEGMVRLHRSHGLPDDQIALLMLDELTREGVHVG